MLTNSDTCSIGPGDWDEETVLRHSGAVLQLLTT